MLLFFLRNIKTTSSFKSSLKFSGIHHTCIMGQLGTIQILPIWRILKALIWQPHWPVCASPSLIMYLTLVEGISHVFVEDCTVVWKWIESVKLCISCMVVFSGVWSISQGNIWGCVLLSICPSAPQPVVVFVDSFMSHRLMVFILI